MTSGRKTVYSRKTLERARYYHGGFAEVFLPAVVGHARWVFRGLRAERKEELIQIATGNAWRMMLDLIDRGRNPYRYVGSIAKFSVLKTINGVSVCGEESRTDALSRNARRRHGFEVFTA